MANLTSVHVNLGIVMVHLLPRITDERDREVIEQTSNTLLETGWTTDEVVTFQSLMEECGGPEEDEALEKLKQVQNRVFDRLRPEDTYGIRCVKCGKDHEGTRKEAWDDGWVNRTQWNHVITHPAIHCPGCSNL